MPIQNRLLDKIEKFSLSDLRQIISSFIGEQQDIKSSLNLFPIGYFYLDKNYKIIFANDYAKRFFLKSNDLKKKSFFKVLSDHALSEEIKKIIFTNKTIHDTEIKVSNKNQDIYLSLSCYPIFEEEKSKEKIKGYTLSLINTTPWRKKYHSENIRHSIESLSTLTSGIAHEIKNPLGAIDLHLQLIERYFKKNKIEDDYLLELTKVLKDEINRLDKIVNDFLLSVRPIKIKKELLNLNEIIIDTLNFMNPIFNENEVEIVSELTEEFPLYPFDKYSMKQVLINLFKNSVEAIKEKKTKKKKIIVKTFFDAYSLFLEIKDNGIGISEEKIAQIFDAYFTTKKMGTGLGLSIVSNIIKKHDGDIDFFSTVGKGTKIELSFHFNQKRILLN